MFCPKTNFAPLSALFVAFFELKGKKKEKKNKQKKQQEVRIPIFSEKDMTNTQREDTIVLPGCRDVL